MFALIFAIAIAFHSLPAPKSMTISIASMSTLVILSQKCPFVAEGPLSPSKKRIETVGRNGGVVLDLEIYGTHFLSHLHSALAFALFGNRPTVDGNRPSPSRSPSFSHSALCTVHFPPNSQLSEWSLSDIPFRGGVSATSRCGTVDGKPSTLTQPASEQTAPNPRVRIADVIADTVNDFRSRTNDDQR